MKQIVQLPNKLSLSTLTAKSSFNLYQQKEQTKQSLSAANLAKFKQMQAQHEIENKYITYTYMHPSPNESKTISNR